MLVEFTRDRAPCKLHTPYDLTFEGMCGGEYRRNSMVPVPLPKATEQSLDTGLNDVEAVNPRERAYAVEITWHKVTKQVFYKDRTPL